MIRVTMVDKSIRVYNNGKYYESQHGWLRLGSAYPIDEHSIAMIRNDLVAVVEFATPCRIIYPKKRKRA